MPNQDASRIEIREEESTFTGFLLSQVLGEIDRRVNAKDCYLSITRTSDLVSKTEYFSDIARTTKVMERQFSRTTGSDGIDYITGITSIFYNDDTSEDSRVTISITRDGDDRITQCNGVFSTGE